MARNRCECVAAEDSLREINESGELKGSLVQCYDYDDLGKPTK